RRKRLAIAVVAPTRDRALGLDRAGVLAAGADLPESTRRHVAYAVGVGAPAGKPSVGPDRATEGGTVIQRGRDTTRNIQQRSRRLGGSLTELGQRQAAQQHHD